ncbi:hypothetical protein GBFDFA_04060 [Edwardsiella anguillarum]|uniref:hypothetical protein n=1 Tax=Edwardsiella anguillarum TaxID=1821960 RepID=UPI00045CEE9A|nr:hypothetical protein [Edwardsiella anguillarum]AKM48640.1 hypothetical protein QY76_16225 [Edwardsiella sp. EA181011]GAJ66686.1 hypothetical protein MA13_contig00003-0022 [Edwardsiella piscicida]RFS99786.1 hypothetical protein CGL57_18230 [Edwardsiella anguillarum]BET80018.1 hypothetical protein PBOPBF_04065 [Edwardsiella anguillarum]BET83306.1 hypothetical protein GHNJMD_04370 [Edwardsiella anguillarum]
MEYIEQEISATSSLTKMQNTAILYFHKFIGNDKFSCYCDNPNEDFIFLADFNLLGISRDFLQKHDMILITYCLSLSESKKKEQENSLHYYELIATYIDIVF